MSEEQTPLLGGRAQTRRLWWIACLLLALCGISALAWPRRATHRVIIKAATLNIRYAPAGQTCDQSVEAGGEHCWAERRHGIYSQVLWEMSDIISFQEVLAQQLDDLQSALGRHYDHVGIGRDDGDRAGEAVPIFWKRDAFSQVGEADHFWLSKTPDVPGSIDWDAAQTRMASRVSLRALSSGLLVHAVATHFDDQGPVSRGKAAGVILQRLAALLSSDDLVILMGDLNSEPHELGYRGLTGHRYNNQSAPFDTAPAFFDTRREAASPSYGENGTFTDFVRPGREKESEIDFVLFSDRRWTVDRVAVLPYLFGSKGIRFSDHRMVLAVLSPG